MVKPRKQLSTAQPLNHFSQLVWEENWKDKSSKIHRLKQYSLPNKVKAACASEEKQRIHSPLSICKQMFSPSKKSGAHHK